MRTRELFAACLLLTSIGLYAESKEFTIDPAGITISGVSAGGHMAHQLHVAYSDLFSGVGIVAAGPYGCAAGSLATAMDRCMARAPSEMPVKALLKQMQDAAAQGSIAPLAALADDPVWLFHGTEDEVVATGVADGLHSLYGQLTNSSKLVYINTFEAAHHFPTQTQGHGCLESQLPFIGACKFDAAGKLLAHLYGPLRAPTKELGGELREIEVPGVQAASLMEQAYLYVPFSCGSNRVSCRLHVVLHGCAQSAQTLKKGFIEQSGYLRWADGNQIVLLYPQVKSSATNPYGCWDWWGYTGSNYLERDGAQMSAVVRMVNDLLQ